MKRRWKILIAIGTAIGLAVLLSVIHHYQLRAATEAYIAELKAKGEPMELAQVLPPPVPPEKNSAGVFRSAASLIDADQSLGYSNYVFGMKMVAAGKAMIRWQQSDIRDSYGTNSWDEVESAVRQNMNSLTLLRQIIDKPDFDFGINYEQGTADLVFSNLYLIESKGAAQRLETAAFFDLHSGDTVSAVTNLRAILAVAKAMGDERLEISELVRMAIVRIAVSVNWELLQSPNATDGQLSELEHDWAALDFIRSDEKALEMERVAGEITLAKWRGSDSELQRYFDLGNGMREAMGLTDDETLWDKARTTAKVFMWRSWWSYPDELRSLRGCDALITAVRLVETNGSFHAALEYQNNKLDGLGISKMDDEISALFSAIPSSDMNFHTMDSQSIVVLSPIIKMVMRLEAAKQSVIAAIALKRYQLKHGNVPPDLNSLVPGFLASVPLDPVDGQPLRYRRNADGTFLLYSVGENGKDDGGDPSLAKGAESSSYYWLNPHALDWVWPQPATPEEIQNVYAHPPK
jgi:hypothetical protein